MSVACCLNDRWYVKKDKPMPDMGSPTAAAYRTEDVGALGSPYFALICDTKLPARLEILEALQKINSPNLLVPVDVGPVLWSPTNRRCRIMVFPEPDAKRLIKAATESFVPWTEPEILVAVVAPMLGLLMKMEQAGVTHRAIRADNLFVSGHGTQRKVILHECLSVPPAFDQPPGYLTIDDASTDPPGRSNGTIADELYALGVLILHLLTGRLPGAGVAPEQLLEAKLEVGSYEALVGEQALPTAITELVRGLIADRPAERWTINDIAGWLDGKKKPLRATAGAVKARRKLEIDGRSFASVIGFVHWLVAAEERFVSRALRHEDLEPWLSANLNNPRAIERFKVALSSGDDRGREAASLVSRVAIILDPTGPIRYQRVSCSVDGIGAEISTYLQQGAPPELKFLSEMVAARLPQFCAANQTDISSKMGQRAFVFEKIARLLSDAKPGNGIERAAYELVPSLHCLSPLVERQFVDSLPGMLPALEAAVSAGAIDGWPVDRHIIAFIAARSPESIDGQLSALNHTDVGSRWGATARMLAKLQNDSGPTSLPGLCRIMAALGAPLVDRFRNRSTRKKVKLALAEAAKTGRLKPLVDELDDEDALKRDAARFERARAGFKGTERGLEKCDQAVNDLPRRSAQVGHAVSVTVSAVLSVGIALVSLLAMGIF